uniref:Protein kinase domain-containing protein n=1 Tax=viral metagenome TaxID=1070528 RepID=A0A6C0DIW2_9ZZZZ
MTNIITYTNKNTTTMNSFLTTTDDFTIFQDKKKPTLFTIIPTATATANKSIQLFRSLTKTKIIQSGTILDNGSSFTLKAHSIKTLDAYIKDKLPYSSALNMVYCLSKQLDYLINYESKCFYAYDPKNVIIVDGTRFVYLSQEHLKDVQNNNIYIYHPITKNSPSMYLSPELSSAESIPLIIHYKTIFYSLGLLIREFLSSDIKTIKETKLYYFLNRCLTPTNPENRVLLYV